MQGQQSASSSHATPGPIRGPFSNQSPPVPPSQSQHPCPPTHPAQPPQQSTSRRESYGAPPVASTSAAAAGPPASSLSPDWTAAQIDAEKNSIISLLQSVAATGQGCFSKFYATQVYNNLRQYGLLPPAIEDRPTSHPDRATHAILDEYNQFCIHDGFATFPILGYTASFYLSFKPFETRQDCAETLEKYRSVTSYLFVDERPLEAHKNVLFTLNDFEVWRELVRQSQRPLYDWIVIRELIPTVYGPPQHVERVAIKKVAREVAREAAREAKKALKATKKESKAQQTSSKAKGKQRETVRSEESSVTQPGVVGQASQPRLGIFIPTHKAGQHYIEKSAEGQNKRRKSEKKESKARQSSKAKGKQREESHSNQHGFVDDASHVLGYEAMDPTDEATRQDVECVNATWNCMKSMIRLKTLIADRKLGTYNEQIKNSATNVDQTPPSVPPLSSRPQKLPVPQENATSRPSSNISLPKTRHAAPSQQGYKAYPSHPTNPAQYSEYRPSMAPMQYTPGIYLSPVFPSHMFKSILAVLTTLPLPPLPHYAAPHFPVPLVSSPVASTSRHSREKSIEIIDLCSPSPSPPPPSPKVLPSVLATSSISAARKPSAIASSRVANSIAPPQFSAKRSVEPINPSRSASQSRPTSPAVQIPSQPLLPLKPPPVVQIPSRPLAFPKLPPAIQSPPRTLPPPKFPPLLNSPLERTPLQRKTALPSPQPVQPIQSSVPDKSLAAAEAARRAVKNRVKMKERLSREEEASRIEEVETTAAVGPTTVVDPIELTEDSEDDDEEVQRALVDTPRKVDPDKVRSPSASSRESSPPTSNGVSDVVDVSVVVQSVVRSFTSGPLPLVSPRSSVTPPSVLSSKAVSPLPSVSSESGSSTSKRVIIVPCDPSFKKRKAWLQGSKASTPFRPFG